MDKVHQKQENNWHALSEAETAQLLSTDCNLGLKSNEIDTRRERYGVNRLTEQATQHPFVRFLLQFHQPLVYILLAATGVALFLSEWVDAGVILAVVLMNAVIGYLQEAKALNAIAALAKSMHSTNTVLRDGQRVTIDAEELVPGDIVLLRSGDKVPADLRLISIKDLKIDESALTGESVPVEKEQGVLAPEQALADRKNMGYSSTLVTFGTGAGVVVSTGDNTEIGRISAMIASTDTLDTPLTKRIAQFSHYLIYAILTLAALAIVLGAFQGKSLVDSFMASVALAVAAIPEGLPAAVTIMLAIGVARMARRRAIIRRLPAVETLGSTTVVCSDKTGTLTQNQMTVQTIVTLDGHFAASGSGYAPAGEITAQKGSLSDAALHATLLCGRDCNDAQLKHEDGLWQVEGDPTEGALLAVARKQGVTLADAQPRIDTLPFESAHQYMATLHGSGDAGELLLIKGSVEKILPRCASGMTATGATAPIEITEIEREAEDLAGQGLRVLAFAQRRTSGSSELSHDSVGSELVFLGLQGMLDPPRPEAIEAVSACLTAGVKVKMITGDHVLTATKIAGDLGLIGDERATDMAVTGAELDKMDDQALSEVAENASVFARVTPDNKYRLVDALQRQGHVVAMTGDGVNDAPALRRADIGVAMALGGTEVAREASDMMLTDDNFATIRSAIEEGRGIFDNLKKFIVWTLPTNGGEGLVILLAILLGAALPILPVQILWINLTTAILLGLMLVFEPREDGTMLRPPHPPNTALLDRALLVRILIVSLLLCIGAFGLYEYELLTGSTEAQARTVAVTVFIIGEAFYLLNCRSLERSLFEVGLWSNPWIWGGIASMLILQLAFVYAPVMNTLFSSAPIDPGAWLRATAWGLLIFLVIGIEKHWRRRHGQDHAGSPVKRIGGAQA